MNSKQQYGNSSLSNTARAAGGLSPKRCSSSRSDDDKHHAIARCSLIPRLTKKTLYTYIEIPLAGRSSNGRTADSESAYRGSNPCLPAICVRSPIVARICVPLRIFATGDATRAWELAQTQFSQPKSSRGVSDDPAVLCFCLTSQSVDPSRYHQPPGLPNHLQTRG